MDPELCLFDSPEITPLMACRKKKKKIRLVSLNFVWGHFKRKVSVVRKTHDVSLKM